MRWSWNIVQPAYLASVGHIQPSIRNLVALFVIRPGFLQTQPLENSVGQPACKQLKASPVCCMRFARNLTLKQSWEQKTLAGFGSCNSRHLGHCNLPDLPQLHRREGQRDGNLQAIELTEHSKRYSSTGCTADEVRTWHTGLIRFLASSLPPAGLTCSRWTVHLVLLSPS